MSLNSTEKTMKVSAKTRKKTADFETVSCISLLRSTEEFINEYFKGLVIFDYNAEAELDIRISIDGFSHFLLSLLKECRKSKTPIARISICDSVLIVKVNAKIDGLVGKKLSDLAIDVGFDVSFKNSSLILLMNLKKSSSAPLYANARPSFMHYYYESFIKQDENKE